MAYRACFQCELLFEVDAGDLAANLTCPQCGRPVEPYDPEDEELEAPEATVTVEPGQLSELDPAIVKTMAFDGLSDAVKARA
ncbi:MAG: hypothetical protein KC613_21740, partial [Myxococcales bacterium]|nr:hypothetical protein [Myxococcales bacterium]